MFLSGMKFLLAGAILVVTSAALLAQAPAKDQRHETAHLVAAAVAVSTPVAAGSRVSLRLDVAPKATMHVYSPEQKDYIPVSLTIEKNAAFTAQPAVFPKAETYYFKALEETQLVYSKPFQIVQNVTMASVKAGATVIVKGTLEYQACDESVCYRPASIPVNWTLTSK